MAEKISRLGFLGLAIEATAGTPEATPDIFVPYVENSLKGMHEPIQDISARTSRIKASGSVLGKKWGEGSVKMYLDSLNAPYLLKLAFGQEARTQLQAAPPVHDHLFTPTVSGNAATAATLWNNQGVDTEQYSYATIDTCEIEVDTEGIATINAGFMSKAPSTGVTAPTLTTTSGTLFTWKDMSVQFGTTVQAALAASATKVTNIKINVKNNLSLNYKSGSNSPDTVTYGPLEVDGSFTLFFETVTDRNAFYNLTKRSMVISFAGAGLGGGYTEKLSFVFKKTTIQTIDMETGLDDLYALTCNFFAEQDQDQAGFVDIIARNAKASNYA